MGTHCLCVWVCKCLYACMPVCLCVCVGVSVQTGKEATALVRVTNVGSTALYFTWGRVDRGGPAAIEGTAPQEAVPKELSRFGCPELTGALLPNVAQEFVFTFTSPSAVSGCACLILHTYVALVLWKYMFCVCCVGCGCGQCAHSALMLVRAL